LKTEKFKSSAVDAGSALMDGISSALGTSKVKRQQQEIENLKDEKQELQREIAGLNRAIKQEQQEKQQLTGELNKIHYWLPDTPKLIKWGEYCRKMGFTDNQAKDLINMKPVRFSGELYSTEHSQKYTVYDAEVRFDLGREKSNGFCLRINGIDLTQWFRQKYDEFREALGLKPKQTRKMGENKGFRM
jgi:FtsZ-binding cell division protein ZapB